jgi:hypothetical protein
MRIATIFRLFSLAAALFLMAENIFAWPIVRVNFQNNEPGNNKKANPDPRPKYNFHEASSLSGITLQPDKNSGHLILRFDQQLNETGTLSVKNTAGKVLYSSLLQPEKVRTARTMNIGKLIPGLYSIEVKTAQTTFWKKIRVRK